MLEESRQGEALELNASNGTQEGKKLYIESYGCQMNFSDSEIVASVLGMKDTPPQRIWRMRI
jgi:tRNA-2-methylthio-N6-dimethylallyladenosine synthase